MSSSHLSVATAIEKNRIASETAFVLLIDIIVTNDLGEYIETVSLAKNSEPVIYQGTEYAASNFSIKMNLDVASTPTLQCVAEDPSGVIRDKLESYNGGTGFKVNLCVVNSGNLDQPPEISESFIITSAAANGFTVTITMGVSNPIATRFPNRLQWRDQCSYQYKGSRCKYTGDLPTCDFTYNGTNGCVFHSNAVNYGGFLGLQNLMA
jgi:phage-related protein